MFDNFHLPCDHYLSITTITHIRAPSWPWSSFDRDATFHYRPQYDGGFQIRDLNRDSPPTYPLQIFSINHDEDPLYKPLLISIDASRVEFVTLEPKHNSL